MDLNEQRTGRNPGPQWGYRFLILADRIVPGVVSDSLHACGAFIAFLLMPRQRRYSAEYLTALHDRKPSPRTQWRHFHAFALFLRARLRRGIGITPQFYIADGFEKPGAAFLELLRTGTPTLYGTFHIGWSDLLGFDMAAQGHPVAMVRLRVGNSDDTENLHRQTSSNIRMIWVNEPSEMLMAFKQAMDSGLSIAMQCDRLEYASRKEAFYFLGARRWFPFTIYHLSAVFGKPVVFCIGLPMPDGRIATYIPPVFHPDDRDRASVLIEARRHFQEVLDLVERLLRAHPYQWFNFIPLNQENRHGV